MARRPGGREVLLRIEDHDRQRCRPEFDAALLEDLDWLGFAPTSGPLRQSDDDAPYQRRARAAPAPTTWSYGCDCSRATFDAWAGERERPWRGPGCPGAVASAASTAPVAARRARRRRGALDGRARRAVRRRGRRGRATCPSATGTATGHTGSRSSWTTSGRASTWSSAAGTCSSRRRPRSGSARLLGRDAPPTFAPPRADPAARTAEALEGRRATRRSGSCAPRADRAPDLIGEAAAAIGLIESPRPIEAPR